MKKNDIRSRAHGDAVPFLRNGQVNENYVIIQKENDKIEFLNAYVTVVRCAKG